MAYRKKAKHIMGYKPDIVVVPECENPNKLKFEAGTPAPNDILWFGKNPDKGIGIFSYSGYSFRVCTSYDPAIRHVIPIQASNGKFKFTLFAIWAYNPDDPEGRYIEQVWKALHSYKRLIKTQKTILMGDFNSNSIWDTHRRVGNHSDVVERLREKGIVSAYHKHHKQKQGTEKHSTFFMHRHENKPYHIDYCFASEDIANKINSVEIGEYKYWTKFSDHAPLIVSFDNVS